MSENLGTRINEMIFSIIQAADTKYIRPIKRQAFQCSIDCLDNKNSYSESEKCTTNCNKSLHKAMSLIQQELVSFQGRIDRCLMDCQDNVRKEKNEEKARKEFDECAESCVKKLSKLVPETIQTVGQSMDKLMREENIK